MECYPAHIRAGSFGEEFIQSTADHCHKVAEYTEASLKTSGLSCTGRLVGLIHDTGKFSSEFSNYINSAARGEHVRRGSVNHTFAGVIMLFERYHVKDESSLRNMACEIIAFAAGAHHGLFDCIDPNGQDGFAHRLEAENIPYKEVKDNFLALCADISALDKLFQAAADEIIELVSKCKKIVKTNHELLFCVSLICRLVLSALIDGDRQDTAEFMYDFKFREYGPDMRPLWKARLYEVEKKIDALPVNTQVNKARHEISLKCRDFPVDEGGIYRLSIPTGSGKTLASLRFALKTAERYNKSRIFFVIPLLSVLEQNAKVIREYLSCDEIILEHHSNVLRTEQKSEEHDVNELLTETWRSPVVITTLVQLLNTLFGGETTCIRRFNALMDSVLVIDEIQSLPRHMLTQFNMAVNFLSHVCHTVVVLSSATQPVFEMAAHPMRFSHPKDIVPYDARLFKPFRRTNIINLCRNEGYTFEELSCFVIEKLPEARSVLIICNKKDQAESIYRLLCNTDAEVFHLSTSMCMCHREDTLNRIIACLGKTSVICVSTQLVEAGVDFSFGCVIRVLAGLDNVIQAAGRCNRSGEYPCLRPVYIVNIHGEDLKNLKEIREAQNATNELLYKFSHDGGMFDDSLDSDKSVEYYYRNLFANMKGLAQDYPIPDYGTTMYQMLANNETFRLKSNNIAFPLTGQAFKTAGKEFKVFNENTIDVLVPFGEGRPLIADLCSEKAQKDLLYRKQLLDKAKKYTVSLFNYQIAALIDAGGLDTICGGVILSVRPAFYRNDTGINVSGGISEFQEV